MVAPTECMSFTNCPHCGPFYDSSQQPRPKLVGFGRYYRTSDSTWVKRYRCTACKKTVSNAVRSHMYRQKKRQKNKAIVGYLVSKVSMRRAALLAGVTRKTVERVLEREAIEANRRMRRFNEALPKAEIVEFDDLETFEHTKCKPLSVTLAVEHKTRRILGFQVSQMASNGLLAKKSRVLYGKRRDERRSGRKAFFAEIEDLVSPVAVFKSDENPYYPADVRRHFPKATHVTFKGKRGASTGQGELKKVRFDPLFSLNHTCAMLRDNIGRLVRKTWCTTKKAWRLSLHLALYADFHNSVLLKHLHPAPPAPTP
jgi:transposase-like protein